MAHYLGAPIGLGFGAGEGTAALCSEDGHGPQSAGAAGTERRWRHSRWARDTDWAQLHSTQARGESLHWVRRHQVGRWSGTGWGGIQADLQQQQLPSGRHKGAQWEGGRGRLLGAWDTPRNSDVQDLQEENPRSARCPPRRYPPGGKGPTFDGGGSRRCCEGQSKRVMGCPEQWNSANGSACVSPPGAGAIA